MQQNDSKAVVTGQAEAYPWLSPTCVFTSEHGTPAPKPSLLLLVALGRLQPGCSMLWRVTAMHGLIGQISGQEKGMTGW